MLAIIETKHWRLPQLLAMALLAMFVLAGCQREQPIYRVVDSPVPKVSEALGVEEVRKQIVLAAEQAGWVITDAASGRMIAETRWRTHAAIVAIIYDADSYSIDYHDSVNLLVGRIPEGMIHREYNRRVQALEAAISSRLLNPKA